MKKTSWLFFCLLLLAALPGKAQQEEQLNLPGDNLNLYAVMKLFQESPTLESFEQALNKEDNNINNLDLNGDDQTDYIRVVDEVDGNTHTIILRVAIDEKENQDVAVFTVTKNKKGGVEIQLVGDEELYGKNYIVEPNMTDVDESKSTPNPGYKQPTTADDGQEVVVQNVTTVQISAWPIVHFMFMPSYTVWHSPCYWGYYPPWWRPWRPWYWHQYYGFHWHWHWHYHGHYRRSYYHRYGGWNSFYYSRHRSRSTIVIQRRSAGFYRTTYSRPELTRQGSDLYRNRYPDRRVSNKLPPTPTVSRPGSRPGNVNKPAVRPTPGGNTRPSPGGTTRPTTRPTPLPGGNTRPAPKPDVSRPSGGGSTRPAVTKPAARPTPKPAARPAARPAGRGGPQ